VPGEFIEPKDFGEIASVVRHLAGANFDWSLDLELLELHWDPL
jgi:hypothetical protein